MNLFSTEEKISKSVFFIRNLLAFIITGTVFFGWVFISLERFSITVFFVGMLVIAGVIHWYFYSLALKRLRDIGHRENTAKQKARSALWNSFVRYELFSANTDSYEGEKKNEDSSKKSQNKQEDIRDQKYITPEDLEQLAKESGKNSDN